MKKLTMGIAALVLVFGFAGVAMAWGGPGSMMNRGDRQGHQMETMFEQLQVTEAQQEQIEAIMSDMREQHQSAMQGQRPDPDTREQLREAYQAQLLSELGKVLTAEQLDGLSTYMENHDGRQHGAMRGGHQRGNFDMDCNKGPASSS